MGKEKTCEQLIQDRLEEKLITYLPDFSVFEQENVEDYQQEWGFSIDAEDIEGRQDACREHFQEHVFESVLETTLIKKYKVLLSTGGPADWFEFEYSAQGDFLSCVYVYQDWYDGARRAVNDDKGEELAQLFCIGPDFE